MKFKTNSDFYLLLIVLVFMHSNCLHSLTEFPLVGTGVTNDHKRPGETGRDRERFYQTDEIEFPTSENAQAEKKQRTGEHRQMRHSRDISAQEASTDTFLYWERRGGYLLLPVWERRSDPLPLSPISGTDDWKYGSSRCWT